MYTSLGIGVTMGVITCLGHIAADSAHGYCLSCVSFSIIAYPCADNRRACFVTKSGSLNKMFSKVTIFKVVFNCQWVHVPENMIYVWFSLKLDLEHHI